MTPTKTGYYWYKESDGPWEIVQVYFRGSLYGRRFGMSLNVCVEYMGGKWGAEIPQMNMEVISG